TAHIHLLENHRRIIKNNIDTGKLRQSRKYNSDNYYLLISGRKYLREFHFSGLFFEILLYLFYFIPRRTLIIYFTKYSLGVSHLLFKNQPSRTFRHDQEQQEKQDRRDNSSGKHIPPVICIC